MRANPMDVMFVFLGLPTSLASVVGLSQSTALHHVLPWWGPRLWSIALLAGCVAYLIGVTSVREMLGALVIVRLPALLLGLHLISIASLTYAVVVLMFAGWSGLVPAVAYLVVSLGTWVRRVDLRGRYSREDR
ncbi:hypothetical protein [Nonomuraea sp. NPDC050786]|uniref:hypothetical protein n=1 Tax=Nonomuraea sp. NPDC050786 TaxID=3154840 RepID=UPI003409517C